MGWPPRPGGDPAARAAARGRRAAAGLFGRQAQGVALPVSAAARNREKQRGREIGRHRDTETQRHRDTETQRYRDTEIQRQTGTGTGTGTGTRGTPAETGTQPADRSGSPLHS